MKAPAARKRFSDAEENEIVWGLKLAIRQEWEWRRAKTGAQSRAQRNANIRAGISALRKFQWRGTPHEKIAAARRKLELERQRLANQAEQAEGRLAA